MTWSIRFAATATTPPSSPQYRWEQGAHAWDLGRLLGLAAGAHSDSSEPPAVQLSSWRPGWQLMQDWQMAGRIPTSPANARPRPHPRSRPQIHRAPPGSVVFETVGEEIVRGVVLERPTMGKQVGNCGVAAGSDGVGAGVESFQEGVGQIPSGMLVCSVGPRARQTARLIHCHRAAGSPRSLPSCRLNCTCRLRPAPPPHSSTAVAPAACWSTFYRLARARRAVPRPCCLRACRRRRPRCCPRAACPSLSKMCSRAAAAFGPGTTSPSA